MPSFANSALRLLRRLLGAPTRTAGPYAGELTALDGNTAVAVTEAAIAELAVLGASFPADAADAAWRTEQLRHGRNLLGDILGTQGAEGPRGALAGALGLTMGGIRATAFLAAPDLTAAQDLLRLAAGRRLPLVIHLDNRALPGHAIATGSGHETCHLAADSGVFLLFAANVQEAVDLTLIARRIAEETLTPGLVVMDGDQTALAMQEVRLPPAELVTRFLGAPGNTIPAPTATQRLLFGDHRRRVPRWHDPDHPVLLGALQPPEIWGLGAAAASVYFDGQVRSSLEQAVSDFRRETGRSYEPVCAFRAEDARILLLAQGAAVETAQAVAEHLRRTERLRVGVLGLRCLHPFPGPDLLAHLGVAKHLLVLERVSTHLADDPPLLRELRALFDRGLDDTSSDADAPPGHPALRAQDRPRVRSVIYGVGGLPLRGTDLIRLCREAGDLEGSQTFLGMEFTPQTSDYPKRQVLLDRLRRDYPHVAGLGLCGRGPTPDLRPTGALTFAVHRRSGQWGEGLVAETAGFLRRFAGAHLRSHPALFSQPLGSYCIDCFTLSEQALRDPGASMPVDLALLAVDPGDTRIDPLVDLRPDGALLLRGPEQDEALWQTLSPTRQQALQDTGIALYAIPPSDSPSEDLVLGAICGLLLDQGWVGLGPRRLISIRDAQLADAGLPGRQTGDPDREARSRQFQAGLDGIRRIDYQGLPVSELAPRPQQEAPASVRRFGTIDDVYDSLPRFWDQVGVLYRDGAASQLAPDPYMAIGAVPPLLSAFRDMSPLRASLPHLDPDLCTGCGRCWSYCPEGAWGAVAATPSEVLNAAIPAAEAGALRPLAGKLAERIDHSCRAGEAKTATLGDLVSAAYAWLQDQTPLPAARKQSIDTAVERLTAAIGCLPVAVATPFFTEAPTDTPGALLFLALNPNDCKGCGICVHACDAGALQSVAQTTEELEQANRVFTAWERLPETTQAIIDLAAADERVGPLPAALLAHRATSALAGGDGAEAGSGERLVLRLALGLAASRQGQRRAEFTQEVKATHQEITALIRSLLAEALPADDLDALARGLETVSTRHADLGAFLGQTEGAIEGAVDAARLRRLVELAQGLGTLAWRLETGRQGFGRAGLGLVLTPGEAASWAGAFPHNVFQVPVTLDATGDGARLAAGLLEGQLRQAIEGFVLMRRARLELDKPMDAARRWSDLAALSWHDLTPQERERCPSMLLVGSSRILAGAGLSQVAALLGGELPLKILVLADLDLGLSGRSSLESAPAPLPDTATDLGLLALARRDACIAQTSLGAPTHFLESLEAGLAFDGPALFHVHAPSPGRHGFPTDQTLEQARLAVATRTFPLFRYDPKADGVFGTRIELGANPEPLATWERGSIQPTDRHPASTAAKEATLPEDGAMTPAHWALGEARFRHWFQPLAEDAADPLPLDAYLELSESERRGRTPYVSQGQPQRDPARYQVAPELVAVCQERRDAWRLLQELAGLVTPFTERVRREAEEQVAAERQAELAAQAAVYEQKLADLRAELQQELRGDIRERLMNLAGYRHQAGAERPQ
ncbi:4Fe-4S binding protein [Candidatus Thiosymbion oneisti]|uniref:4Fe-4S binding protein n=1 Tax=Candidatus Thiosymbion oneisti TaxID=589554 RepID=UPI00106038DE|nr:4Fe-4S binding protein [Candidatus Thiosymbion oneisti]